MTELKMVEKTPEMLDALFKTYDEKVKRLEAINWFTPKIDPDRVGKEPVVDLAPLREITEKLISYATEFGAYGLSSSQIQADRPVWIMSTGQEGKYNALAWPILKILGGKQKTSVDEGCYSYPGIFKSISRAHRVSCSFLDLETGLWRTLKFYDQESFCLQQLNEIDGGVDWKANEVTETHTYPLVINMHGDTDAEPTDFLFEPVFTMDSQVVGTITKVDRDPFMQLHLTTTTSKVNKHLHTLSQCSHIMYANGALFLCPLRVVTDLQKTAPQ